MAYSLIAFIAPNYRDNANEWLKAYEPGTTTPKLMSLESSGFVTVAKLQLNADGFIKSAGDALVIPYINGDYDLWLFPTAAEADANDTTNAIKVADNINSLNVSIINDLSQAYEFATVVEYKAFTTAFPVGKVVHILERNAKFTVISGTGTANTFNIIASDEVLQSVDLILTNPINVLHFGADLTGTIDSYGAIAAAADAADSGLTTGDRALYIPSGTYLVSATLDWEEYRRISVYGDGFNLSVLSFTNDVDGIRFGGTNLSDLRVVGSSYVTGNGITYLKTGRKIVSGVWAEGFKNGHWYSEGNLSVFDMIFSKGNAEHGFVQAIDSPDHHALTFGAMDLNNNGLDGFHMIEGSTPNVAQQNHGGTITCQTNGRYGAYISGRGHKLTIYEENNGNPGVVFSPLSEGNQVDLLFGVINADNGTNNAWREWRDGSVEMVLDHHLRADNVELINKASVGTRKLSQTTDNVFLDQTAGSGSMQTVSLGRTDADVEKYTLEVLGRLLVNKVTMIQKSNTVNATSIDATDSSFITTANTAPTSITSISGLATGQTLTIVFLDANTTLVNNSSIRLSGGDMVGTVNDTITLIAGLTVFHEISRSVNS